MNRFTEQDRADAQAAAAYAREQWQKLAQVSAAHAREERELVEAFERDADRVGEDLTLSQVVYPARQFALRLMQLTEDLKEAKEATP